MPRAHFYGVAQDPAGNAIENSVIRVLQPGSTNIIAAPIYPSDTDVTAMTNPFPTVSGQISFYIDVPQRVRLGITPPSAAERFIEDIDVGSTGGSGGDSSHVGTGTASTSVGLGATSTGNNSTALGQLADSDGLYSAAIGYGASSGGSDASALGAQAVASGVRSTSLGRIASATGPNTTALGGGSSATGTGGSTALGDGAVSNSSKSTALGTSATGGHDHATAVGADAATTEPNQILLGTSSDFADAPGGYALTASNGRRGLLRMLPDGTLTTVWQVPANSPNLLPVDEQSFENSIGSWAAVSGLTSATQSTTFALSGTKSLKMILSGSGAASARSSKVSATPGTVYVGNVRMYYATGAMTAALNGTCWLEFYNAGNTIIGSAFAGQTRAFFPDTWVRFDVRAVAPALTVTVALRMGWPTGGGASADAAYGDVAGIFAVPGTV